MRIMTALALAVLARGAPAQQPTRVIAAGDRVRIEYKTPVGVSRRVGAVERISSENITLRAGPRDSLITIPQSGIVRAEVSSGRHSRVQQGAVFGAVGLLLGVIASEAVAKYEWREEQVLWCLYSPCPVEEVKRKVAPGWPVPAGILSGVALGLVVRPDERWQSATTPVITVSQRRDFPPYTLGVRLTF